LLLMPVATSTATEPAGRRRYEVNGQSTDGSACQRQAVRRRENRRCGIFGAHGKMI